MSVEFDISPVWRGTDPILRFQLTSTPAGETPPTWTTQFNMRKSALTAGSPIFTKAGVWNTTDLLWEVSLSKTETLAVAHGFYVYTFMRTDTGVADVLTFGKVEFKDNVKDL